MCCSIIIQIDAGRIVRIETTVTMLKVTDNFLSDATALKCCGGGLLLTFNARHSYDKKCKKSVTWKYITN